MAKQTTTDNTNSLDEYTYSEGSYTNAFPAKKPSVFSVLASKAKQQRGVFVLIGVLIIIYVIIKIFNAIEHKRELEAKNSTTPTTQQAAVTAANDTQPQMQQQQPTMQQQQQPYVEQQQSNNGNDVQELANQMQNNMANIDSRLYNIQQGLSFLGQSMQRIEGVLEQQLALQRQQQQARQNLLQHAAAKTYTVYAVIPNRAWLLTPKGATFTVRPGNIIPGVGMVTAIDPIQGTVSTNTGIILRFATGDT